LINILYLLAGTPAQMDPDSTIVFWVITAGCNNRVALHYAIIHNYGSHSYQNIIVDGTAMNYGVVTN
jgi:hypothetical protein